MIRYLLILTLINLAASSHPFSIYVARRGRRLQELPHITPAYIYGRDNHKPVQMYSSRIPRRFSLLDFFFRPSKYLSQNSKKSVRRSRHLKFKNDFKFNAIENFDPYMFKKNSLTSDKYPKVFKSPLSLIKLKKMNPKKDIKKSFHKYKIRNFSVDKNLKNKNEIIIKSDLLKRMDEPNDLKNDFHNSKNKTSKSIDKKLDLEQIKHELAKIQSEITKITRRTDTSSEDQINNIRLNVFEPSNSNSLNLNKDLKISENNEPEEETLSTSSDVQKNDFKMHVYEPPQSTELDKDKKKSDILIRPANVVFQRKGQIMQSRKSKLLKINFDPPANEDEISNKE